jgi:endonuclease/exonuclease/phosphatase family metal-dependent hydrolase
VLRAAGAAVDWAAGEPLVFGGDLNLRPDKHPQVFAELRGRFGLAQPTAPHSIDHILTRGLAIEEPPTPWRPQRREAHQDGLAIRLSDHTPVEAVFRRD